MTNVLIMTHADDEHAPFVAATLRLKGHTCDLWYTADFPSQQTHSYLVSEGRTRFIIATDDGSTFEPSSYDVIWFRRPKDPDLSSLELHPDDLEFVKQSTKRYRLAYWTLLNDSARWAEGPAWVNTPIAALKAEGKLNQLEAAGRVGLKVPDTLVSNDPKRIADFLASQPEGCVRKSLWPYVWKSGSQCIFNSTSDISIHDLPGPTVLRSYSEIYQRKIKKTQEIRAFFCRDKHVAVSLQPGDRGDDLTDWRIFHISNHAKASIITLPQEIASKCVDLLRALGLETASFDLLVDEKGEIYFSEINQAGQFMWMEHHGVRVLDFFAEFLVSLDPKTADTAPGSTCLSFSEIRGCREYAEILADMETHIGSPPIAAVSNF